MLRVFRKRGMGSHAREVEDIHTAIPTPQSQRRGRSLSGNHDCIREECRTQSSPLAFVPVCTVSAAVVCVRSCHAVMAAVEAAVEAVAHVLRSATTAARAVQGFWGERGVRRD